MLTVIDGGVKLQLQHTPQPQRFLTLMLITAILLTSVGLGLAMGWMSVRWSIASIAFIAGLSWLWRFYQKRAEVPTLSGGELTVLADTLSHQGIDGKTQRIIMAKNDTLQVQNNQLIISNAQGRVRYQIAGFQSPQQLQVAQAVLEGKTIQTQGKAIRMNPTSQT